MTGNRSKLLKGVAWIGAASVLVNSLGIISTILLARLLMPADFGLIAIATAVIAILGAISEFSVYQALVQLDAPEREHYDTAWTLNVLRAAVVAGLIALLAIPLGNFYGDPRLTPIIWLMSGTTLVGGFVNPKLAVFERRLQFNQTFILRLTGKVVGFVATIGIAYYYRSYWALVIGPLVTETVLVGASYMLFPFAPKPSLSRFKDLFSYSIWLTFGKWVQAVSWRSDPLVLGYFFTPELLGQFAMGNRMTSKLIGEIIAPIKKVLFPAFARIRNDAARLRAGYVRSQGVLCMMCFPIAAGFAVLSPEIIVAVLGERWRLAIPVAQVMAITRILQITENLAPLAMATGDTKRLLGRDIRAFIIRWPLIVLGIYLGWGDNYDILLGALFGRLAAVACNTVLNIDLIRKITSITVKDHFLAIWRPALAAGAMTAGLVALRPLLPFGSDFTGLVSRIAVMIPAGASMYFAVLVLIWVATGRKSGVETETVSIVIGMMRKLVVKLRGFRKVSR